METWKAWEPVDQRESLDSLPPRPIIDQGADSRWGKAVSYLSFLASACAGVILGNKAGLVSGLLAILFIFTLTLLSVLGCFVRAN